MQRQRCHRKRKHRGRRILTKLSATTVAAEGNRQYHLDCKPGDLAENILMVGDPERVKKVLTRFESVRFQHSHREYVVATGLFQGVELSVLATGMGQDTTEIAVIESCQITKSPTFIRCGSSGALQPEPKLGDLAISQASLRLDKTTYYYVPDSYPAIADTEVVLALAQSCKQNAAPFHVGLTASAPGFFGPQGRELPGFPIRFPELPNELARCGVMNFEMETATLFTLAKLRGVRAGAICAIFGNRSQDQFADPTEREKAEARCIDAALQAFPILQKMDAQKNEEGTPIWTPS